MTIECSAKLPINQAGRHCEISARLIVIIQPYHKAPTSFELAQIRRRGLEKRVPKRTILLTFLHLVLASVYAPSSFASSRHRSGSSPEAKEWCASIISNKYAVLANGKMSLEYLEPKI